MIAISPRFAFNAASCILRRLRQWWIRHNPNSPKKATPPTAPPAIAPAGVPIPASVQVTDMSIVRLQSCLPFGLMIGVTLVLATFGIVALEGDGAIWEVAEVFKGLVSSST